MTSPLILAADRFDPPDTDNQDPSADLGDYHNDPAGFAEDLIDWPANQAPTSYQLQALDELETERRLALRALHGVGKAHLLAEKILTTSGWTTIGELRPGARVFDHKGRPTTVTHVHEVHRRPCYRVRFSDGQSVVVSDEHAWSVIDFVTGRNHRAQQPGPVDWRDCWHLARVRTTSQLAAQITVPNGGAPAKNWLIPNHPGLHMPDRQLPIPPYTLGVWLAEGTKASASVTLNSEDSPGIRQHITADGFTLSERPSTVKPGSSTWTIHGLSSLLRETGLMGNKHVPAVYQLASQSQRLALLQGIMDGDGFLGSGRGVGLDLMNKQLAHDVVELVRGFGWSVTLREGPARITEPDGTRRDVGTRWRMAWRPDRPCFRLPRYLQNDQSAHVPQFSRWTARWITDIEPVGDHDVRCLSVSSPDRLYLVGEGLIATHNTTTASLAILWFAVTREHARQDWKIPTTASAWRQLTHFLWPEIRKWATRIRWDLIGRPPLERGRELMERNLKLRHGEAFAVACSDAASIEGAHADQLFYVFDEAKAIPAETFDAAEGAFSGSGTGNVEAYALALSTPGEPMGRFYEICARKPGYEDWSTARVTLPEAVAAGRVSREWAEQRKRQWGETSALYRNRVEGEFAASEEDSVIPLAWVEAAIARWHDHVDDQTDLEPLTATGVDVARGGEDVTVFAQRYGMFIADLEALDTDDTMKVSGRAKRIAGDAQVIVDVVGVGAGVVDRLREQGVDTVAFNGGESAKGLTDASGELEFRNKRSASWWRMRELLDPANDAELMLPDDDELVGDLTAPTWWETSGGKIAVETKDEIKKRLGRSPDRGDAAVYACWEEPRKVKQKVILPGGFSGASPNRM